MKIYLLIIEYWNLLLDSLFPRKVRQSTYNTIVAAYQRYNTFSPHYYSTRFVSCFLPYQNPVIKKSIWNFKYHRMSEETRAFSDILYDEVTSRISDSISMRPAILIYPPSTSYTKRTKSFDHMKVLSVHMEKLQNQQHPFFMVQHDIFSVKQDLPPQHRGTKIDRVLWSKHKYELRKEIDLNNCLIVCIDDILTTGSTMRAISRLLKRSFTCRIICLTLTH